MFACRRRFDVLLPLVFPVLSRVDALLDQIAGGISGCPGFGKADLGIGADGKQVFLPAEPVLPAP
jgi:hypothetical protein